MAVGVSKPRGFPLFFVLDWWEIPLHESSFLPGSAAADFFGHGIPLYRVFALRIVFAVERFSGIR